MASDSNPTTASQELLSHFRPTVCLQDWWLIKSEKVFLGKRLAVAGVSSTEQRAVRVFSSAPIIKRYDVFTLETADGITVVIKGFINKQRTIQNGFPLEVFNHFLFGFPPHWEEYAEKCFSGDSTSGFVSKQSAIVSSTHDLEKLMMNSKSADSGKTMDILEEIPCQSKSQVLKNQSRRSNRKGQEGQVSEIESKTETKMFLSGPVGSEHVKDTVANIRWEIGESIPDLSKFGLQELHNATVEELDDGRPEIGGKIISKLSKFGPQESQNLTLEELDDGCLKDGFQQNSELSPAYTEAKCKQNHENAMIRSGRKSKNTNESVRSPTGAGKGNEKTNLETPVRERASSSGRKTKRKLLYNIEVNHPSIDEIMEVSIDSPELSSFKRSRSGRLLLPSLDFWRNQVPVYDADRRITGIQGVQHVSKSSRGSGSKPQRKRGTVK